MIIIAVLSAVLAISYFILMVLYTIGWQLQKSFILPTGFIPHTFISVIVPARNEEQHIGACLDGLLAQSYPSHLYEIIVVDDFSEDNTRSIVHSKIENKLRYFFLGDYLADTSSSYKKAALDIGIQRSKGELIITTDADCLFPKDWLLNFAAVYEKEHPMVILAPVLFTCDNSLLQIFQQIDFTVYQGITAATHIMNLGKMSSGANLAFKKSSFVEIDGYKNIDKLATGDDYLLVWKMTQLLKQKISYLKTLDATVLTTPQYNWKGFLNQRIRWASKSGKYDDKRLTIVLILVYLFNLMLLLLFLLGFFNMVYWQWLIILLIFKIIFELIFIVPVFSFYNIKNVILYHIILQSLHVIYIVIAGLLGFVGKYEWKGRKLQ